MNDVAVSFNSSFSRSVPHLQLAWDSVSLGALKECPRKYYYSIVCGWTHSRDNVHLIFGLLFHSAIERYDHHRATGTDYETAVRETVRWTLCQTWNSKLKRPWLSDDPNKNRLTLLRTIVWYLDQFKDDPVQTVILANGNPAVELSYQFDTEYSSKIGEHFVLCGHLDRIGKFNDQIWILDKKTTKQTLSVEWFDKYSPDNQFSGYSLAGKLIYNLPVAGLIVDAAQVAVTFSRFMRLPVQRTDSQLTEWYHDLGYWLRQAEDYAIRQYWPMNDKSCDHYGGCPFRQICSKSPAVRDEWIRRDFVQRTWDPLQARGDI